MKKKVRIDKLYPVNKISSLTCFCTTFLGSVLSFTSLPDPKGNLQQCADTRNKEYGTDEVALCEPVMLETQPL